MGEGEKREKEDEKMRKREEGPKCGKGGRMVCCHIVECMLLFDCLHYE